MDVDLPTGRQFYLFTDAGRRRCGYLHHRHPSSRGPEPKAPKHAEPEPGLEQAAEAAYTWAQFWAAEPAHTQGCDTPAALEPQSASEHCRPGKPAEDSQSPPEGSLRELRTSAPDGHTGAGAGPGLVSAV